MKKQLTFSLISDEPAQAKTKKKAFPEDMERIMPIAEWVEMIRPCYYKGERGNKSYDLELEEEDTGEYKMILSTGLRTVKLDAPITEEYAFLALEDEIDETQPDTDEDGLPDYKEINFSVKGADGKPLIKFVNGIVGLPTYGECVDIKSEFTYVERGLYRFDNQLVTNADFISYVKHTVRVLPIISDPTSEDGDGDGIMDCLNNDLNKTGFYLDSEDTAPLKKGLEGDIIGKLYLVSSDSDMGHAFLMYKSYVYDSLDFSKLYYVYSNVTWQNFTGRKYDIIPEEYITIGNSGDTDERMQQMIAKLLTTETPFMNNNIAYSILYEPTVGGVHINRELFNVHNKESSYISNAAIYRDITSLQMEQLIEYHVSHNQYIFGLNNCATVATGAWDILFNEYYGELVFFVVDPNQTKKKLENIGTDYFPIEINFKDILTHNEEVINYEKIN